MAPRQPMIFFWRSCSIQGLTGNGESPATTITEKRDAMDEWLADAISRYGRTTRPKHFGQWGAAVGLFAGDRFLHWLLHDPAPRPSHPLCEPSLSRDAR